MGSNPIAHTVLQQDHVVPHCQVVLYKQGKR